MYDKEEYARDLRRQMEESRIRREAEKRLLKEEDWKYMPKEPSQNHYKPANSTVAETLGRSLPPPLTRSPRAYSPRPGVDLDIDRIRRDLEDKRTENRDLIARIQDKIKLRLGHVLSIDS